MPFYTREKEREGEDRIRDRRGLSGVTYHDSPSSHFIMTTCEKVMKIKRFVTICNYLWQSTAIKNNMLKFRKREIR